MECLGRACRVCVPLPVGKILSLFWGRVYSKASSTVTGNCYWQWDKYPLYNNNYIFYIVRVASIEFFVFVFFHASFLY